MNPQLKVFGFPSHFIDPAQKLQKEWHLAYMNAFHSEAASSPIDCSIIKTEADNAARHRQYARGQQDKNAYKERLCLPSEKGKLNTSFRNLNWDVFRIGPKLRNTLISMVTNQKLKLNVRTIDPWSMSQKKKRKAKIQEFITNQEHIKQLEALTGMKMDRPVPEEDLADLDAKGLEVYLDMNPSDMAAMEFRDLIMVTLLNNRWDSVINEVVGDMTDVAPGVVHCYTDEANMIKVERWIPERVICNKCLTNDFRDLIRVGYYEEMTVSQLKKITNGSLGEEVYKDLANKAAGSQKYQGAAQIYFAENSFSYAYDVEKIKVLKAYWYSTDTYVESVYKNRFGNTRVEEHKFDYVPFKGDPNVNEGKGMSDQEYEKHSGKTIYRREIQNVYQCSWVVGTDIIYNYGLLNNMKRSASSIAETRIPVAMYTTDGISTIGNIESVLDQFQLNWLQFQAHIAASKPPGIAVEMNSLVRASMKPGQGGQSINWKNLLQEYAETGNLVFNGLDQHGQPLPWFPVQELKNGLSQGAKDHLEIMIQMLDFIRTILGINSLVEGEAPPERLGKKVMEMSMDATGTALNYLSRGYRTIYQDVCEIIAGMMPDAIEKGQLPGMAEMLGTESMRFFDLNKDLGLREMGIYVQEGPDDLIRQRISEGIQIAIKNGDLNPEDSPLIEMEENPYRAIQMLRNHRIKKRREKLEDQKALSDHQAQNDAALAKAKEQEMRLTNEMSVAREFQLKEFEIGANSKIKNDDFTQQVILLKLQHQMTLSAAEQDFINKRILELDKIREKGEQERMTASIEGNFAIDVQKEANKKPLPKPTAKK
jgi:hypothetical protein